MVFLVVMYRCDSWTIKKAEHQITDVFKLWYWRRLFESPLNSKEIKLVNLKGINPELEGLMLKLKLQYFGHLMWRVDSLEKTLMLGTIEGRRTRGRQRMRWLDGIIDLLDMNMSKLWDIVKNRETWHIAVHGVTMNRTWLNDWTTTISDGKAKMWQRPNKK